MRKWKPSLMGTAGTGLGLAGITGLVVAGLEDFRPDLLGIVFLIMGVMLICTKDLRDKNLAGDEIYNTGRERGELDGYDQGYEVGYEDGQKARPVVVELRPKCEDCGKPVTKSLVL